MSTKQLFAVALVVAILSYVLMQNQIDRNQQSPNQVMISVISAEVDIPAGTTLTREHLEKTDVPQTYLTPTAIRAEAVDTLLGQTLGRPVTQGTLLSWDDVPSKGRQLSDDIPRQHRAFTIEVDSASAQAGQLTPGDHVDVLGVFSDDRGALCRTVVEDVRILSIGGQRLSLGILSPFSNITLDLTTEQCQIMALALEHAKISLTLRGQDDHAPAAAPPTHMDSLIKADWSRER